MLLLKVAGKAVGALLKTTSMQIAPTEAAYLPVTCFLVLPKAPCFLPHWPPGAGEAKRKIRGGIYSPDWGLVCLLKSSLQFNKKYHL
jgi:hypothetical protein